MNLFCHTLWKLAICGFLFFYLSCNISLSNSLFKKKLRFLLELHWIYRLFGIDIFIRSNHLIYEHNFSLHSGHYVYVCLLIFCLSLLCWLVPRHFINFVAIENGVFLYLVQRNILNLVCSCICSFNEGILFLVLVLLGCLCKCK